VKKCQNRFHPRNGQVANSVSPRIDTSELKKRIQEQNEQILMLKEVCKTNTPGKIEKDFFPILKKSDFNLKIKCE